MCAFLWSKKKGRFLAPSVICMILSIYRKPIKWQVFPKCESYFAPPFNVDLYESFCVSFDYVEIKPFAVESNIVTFT